MPSFWTDERIDQLKLLVERGLSARDIANELGGTRGAIMGKIHRHGLRLKRPPNMHEVLSIYRPFRNGGAVIAGIKARQKQERAIKAKIGDNRLKSLVIARAIAMGELPACDVIELPPEPSHGAAVALLDLQSSHCRWPIDAATSAIDKLRFCGCERFNGSPYCLRHHKRAYIPSTQRAAKEKVL